MAARLDPFLTILITRKVKKNCFDLNIISRGNIFLLTFNEFFKLATNSRPKENDDLSRYIIRRKEEKERRDISNCRFITK